MFGEAGLVKIPVGVGSDDDDAGGSMDEIFMNYNCQPRSSGLLGTYQVSRRWRCS